MGSKIQLRERTPTIFLHVIRFPTRLMERRDHPSPLLPEAMCGIAGDVVEVLSQNQALAELDQTKRSN